MPTALRETVVAALAAKLAAISAISGLTVARNLSKSPTHDDCPLLVVREGTQRLHDEASSVKIYDATVEIEGYVTAASDALLGPAINELWGRALDALEADKTLGVAAVVTGIEGDLAIEQDYESGHRPMLTFRLEWTVRYQAATPSHVV